MLIISPDQLLQVLNVIGELLIKASDWTAFHILVRGILSHKRGVYLTFKEGFPTLILRTKAIGG